MTNLLPLDDFRRIIGYHPWHFWGFTNATIPITSSCNDLVYKYAWQSAQAAGRYTILNAIETAEGRIKDYLGYPIAPEYQSSKVNWPRVYNRTQYRLINSQPDGLRIPVRLPHNKIQAVGVETLTYIGDARLVFSDQDSDTIEETFTATIATTVTDPAEIACYFIAADRTDSEAVSEKWRISPVKVTISGGTATIIGRAWLLGKPILYEGVSPAGLDPDNLNNFVANISVYRRWTNTDGNSLSTSQGVLIWETQPCHGWWCCCGSCSATYTPDSSTDPAAIAQAIARVGGRDWENGWVIPGDAVYNSTAGTWAELTWDACREPDRVLVRYLAGVPLENQDVAKRWQTIVARMACAELVDRLCACDTANRELYRWQFDLARSAGANDEAYQISAGDLDNPFGTRAGHVYAWKEVKQLQKVGGNIGLGGSVNAEYWG